MLSALSATSLAWWRLRRKMLIRSSRASCFLTRLPSLSGTIQAATTRRTVILSVWRKAPAGEHPAVSYGAALATARTHGPLNRRRSRFTEVAASLATLINRARRSSRFERLRKTTASSAICREQRYAPFDTQRALNTRSLGGTSPRSQDEGRVRAWFRLKVRRAIANLAWRTRMLRCETTIDSGE